MLKGKKEKIIAGAVIAVLLAVVFWWGGNAPGLQGISSGDEEIIKQEEALDNTQTAEPIKESEPSVKPTEEPKAENKESAIPSKAPEKTAVSEEQPKQTQNAVKSEEPKNTEPPKQTPANTPKSDLTCTLSVRCDNILKNMDWLVPEKKEIIPKNGVIFAEKEVVFYEGESVFNVLVREMKRNKIHLEFVNTPAYNTAYIEGIANIYEFDCGEKSGWRYKVNGEVPSYGCSKYELSDGDKVEFVYTCSLGSDI